MYNRLNYCSRVDLIRLNKLLKNQNVQKHLSNNLLLSNLEANYHFFLAL